MASRLTRRLTSRLHRVSLAGMVGQLMPAEQRTVRDQVERYLFRMRHSLPFPISTDDCYFGCMPDAVRKMDQAGTFSEKIKPGKAGNMLLTMYQGDVPIKSLDRILHISAEDKQGYSDAMRGLRGHEKMFWIEVCGTYPTPRNSTESPFFLPLDHPSYRVLQHWVNKAYDIETEIESTLKIIEQLTVGGVSAGTVVKVWPEMANFLAWPKDFPIDRVKASDLTRANRIVPPEMRERVTFQLSRATMMPDEQPALKAWVRFYNREV